MTIEENIFRKVRIDFTKLEEVGFHKRTGEDGQKSYVLETEFMDGDFKAILTVREDGTLYGQVIDQMSEEEYLPLRAIGQIGSYPHLVRSSYEELLKELAKEIGIPMPFASEQANRITYAIASTYSDVPDFPWAEEASKEASNAYDDAGVFRVPANQKWYGLIMNIDEKNLKTKEEKEAEKKAAAAAKRLREEERKKREAMKKAGLKPPKQKRKPKAKEDEKPEIHRIDVMNLKIDPAMAEDLHKEKGIYPAFHMNQKSWISVRLDDTLSDARVMELIEASHALVVGKKGAAARRNGPKTWVIPANPKYYDIVGIFDAVDDTIWKQGKGIETGDICYMYVAVPYSAILYKVTVTKAYSAKEPDIDLMDVHIDERYDKHQFTLEKMKEFGVTTVRGPRSIPEELVRYIDANK